MAELAPNNPAYKIEDPLVTRRVNRIRLALHLHCKPEEVDKLPIQDYADLVEILRADSTIADYNRRKNG